MRENGQDFHQAGEAGKSNAQQVQDKIIAKRSGGSGMGIQPKDELRFAKQVAFPTVRRKEEKYVEPHWTWLVWFVDTLDSDPITMQLWI
jgi:hypothetical protein